MIKDNFQDIPEGFDLAKALSGNNDGLNMRDIKLIDALNKDKKPRNKIGVGIHRDAFYFGSVIEIEGKERQVVITSDKNFYVDYDRKNEIKEDFGLNYKYPFAIDALANRVWSNKSIKKFLYDKKLKFITLKDMYNKALEINKEFLFYVDEATHKYISLDIMNSYLCQIFEAKGRTFLNGESGSGKTKQYDIYSLLSFNPVSSSNISGASLYRVVESTGGTLLVDDYDKVNEENKGDVDRTIRVGYKKNQRAIRSEGRSFTPTAFDVYSHALINNINGLDEVTESRCFKITTLKIATEITKKKIQPDDDRWAKWRDDMHICTLQNWKEIQEAYNKLECKELAARNLEVVEANLVLAKMIDLDLYKEVLAYCKEAFEQNILKDLETDWDYLAFKELLKQDLTAWIEFKTITKVVAELLYGECPDRGEYPRDFDAYTKKARGLSITVGRTWTRLPIFKKREVEGVIQYKVGKEDLVSYLKVKYPHLVESVGKVDKEGDKHIHEKMKNPNVSHAERYVEIVKINPDLVDNAGSVCRVFLSYGMQVDEAWMTNHIRKDAEELIKKGI